MKRLKNEITTVNYTTGEIVTTAKEYSIKTTPDSFYMVFIDSMSKIFEIKSLIDRKLLSKLCMKAEFNTGIVSISQADRKVILQELEINSPQMSKSLSNLIKLGLITGSEGTYVINPSVFWKGDMKSRKELLKNNLINITINLE